jgi:uncharacterized protein
MTHINHPIHFDARRRTAEVNDEAYVRDLIEQVLFTSPGERVNRPDFGAGLLRLVFEPNEPELAATIQLLTQGALQHWLGDLVQLESVDVVSEDATISIGVQYVIRRTQERQVARFQREMPR